MDHLFSLFIHYLPTLSALIIGVLASRLPVTYRIPVVVGMSLVRYVIPPAVRSFLSFEKKHKFLACLGKGEETA
jgi:hypothetical protein